MKGIPIGRAVPSTMSRRTNSNNIASGGASRAGQPHDDSLPVVTVAKTRGWLILGHIPRVHQSIVIPIGCAANINLACAATAVTVGRTSRLQPSAETISFQVSPRMAIYGALTWYFHLHPRLGMEHSHSAHTDQVGRRDRPHQWYQMERSEGSQLYCI